MQLFGSIRNLFPYKSVRGIVGSELCFINFFYYRVFIPERLMVVLYDSGNWAIAGWYIQRISLSIKFSVLLVLKAVITFIVCSKTKCILYFSCTSVLIMICHQLFSTNPKLWHYKSLPPYWSLALACKNKVKVQLAIQRKTGGQSFVHRNPHSKTYNL